LKNVDCADVLKEGRCLRRVALVDAAGDAEPSPRSTKLSDSANGCEKILAATSFWLLTSTSEKSSALRPSLSRSGKRAGGEPIAAKVARELHADVST
jgi:hypothetical protein